MLHDFVLNHIILSSIIFILICVFEGYLTLKKEMAICHNYAGHFFCFTCASNCIFI